MSHIDNIYSWENYSQIDADWAVKMDLKNLVDSLFLEEEVHKLEREHGKESQALDVSTKEDSQELDELKKGKYLTEFIELIKIARPEIDSFYDDVKKYLKEDDFPARKLAELREKDWAKGTTAIFVQQKDELDYIEEEHLKDRTLYKMDPGHPRRDFIAALLQKVAKDHFPNDPERWGDRQKLYDLSQKIEKNLLPNLNSQ